MFLNVSYLQINVFNIYALMLDENKKKRTYKLKLARTFSTPGQGSKRSVNFPLETSKVHMQKSDTYLT